MLSCGLCGKYGKTLCGDWRTCEDMNAHVARVERFDGDSRGVRIVSDGTAVSTTIMVNGVVMDNVVAASWEVRRDDLAVAAITFEDVKVKVLGRAGKKWWRPYSKYAQ